MKNYSYLVLVSLLVANTCYADTTTTTTTTTDDNGNVITEETTTTDSDDSYDDPNLIGPAGATGTIRRSDRRQDRRDGDAHIDRR
jgi:hypothetical protein